MSRTTTALVAPELNGKFELREVYLDALQADEVLVEIQASGLCHTDLSCAVGILPCRPNAVLGHEGWFCPYAPVCWEPSNHCCSQVVVSSSRLVPLSPMSSPVTKSSSLLLTARHVLLAHPATRPTATPSTTAILAAPAQMAPLPCSPSPAVSPFTAHSLDSLPSPDTLLSTGHLWSGSLLRQTLPSMPRWAAACRLAPAPC